MIPIAGYMPDADPTTPGVITSADSIVPTLRGSYKSAPSMQAIGINALAAPCFGVVEAQLLDTSTRLVAGTDTKLYETSGTSWVDRSRAGSYTAGTKVWRFSIFGNVTLACNGINILQASTGAGAAFADVAASPICKVMDVSQGFVMMGATNEATYGDQSDRWWGCGIYDYTTWTPSVATQATTGRLVDAPGPIRAMKALGSRFVAYKDKAIFVGSYIGTPLVWQWDLIPSEIGCSSQESVVNVQGMGHIFIGQEDVYLFNGSGFPRPIGDGIKTWLFSDMNPSLRSNIKSTIDRANSNIWWFYPRIDSTLNPTGAVIYNYKSQKWGVWRGQVQAAVEYLTGSVSWDGAAGTWDAQTLNWDSPSFSTATPYPAVIDSTNTIQTITGAAGTANTTFGDVGDDTTFSTLRRARVRFLSAPTSAQMTNQYKNNEGESLITDSVNTMVDSKFDFMRSARLHRVTLQTSGSCEFSAIDYDLQPNGTN